MSTVTLICDVIDVSFELSGSVGCGVVGVYGRSHGQTDRQTVSCEYSDC